MAKAVDSGRSSESLYGEVETMMIVETDAAIQAEPSLYSLIRRAHEDFEATFRGKSSFDSVRACWTLSHDNRDRPVVRLDMEEKGDRAVGEFPVDQLWDFAQVKTRLVRVLSDLMETQSRKLLRQFQDAECVAEGA
jgi:hypothetical protein